MKALVKAQRAPGIWMEDIPEPKVGHNDVMIRVAQDRDLRHRHAHLQLGPVGAEDDPVPMAVGHEYVGRDRRDRQRSAGFRDRRSRLRRRPHHLRLLPQLPRRPPSPVSQHGRRRRRTARAASPNTSSFPRSTRSSCPSRSRTTSPSILDPFGNATHTALVLQPGRRGRADHGRRPDRHHGRRPLPARRRTAHRRHRRERLPARSRAQDGRDASRSTSRASRSTTR